ncbi:MAG: MmpS family transport accessory protein, partial [Chloroflexota bacterium]
MTCIRYRHFILICASLVLLLTACDQETHTIRYEVSGSTSNAHLSYQNESGGTEQVEVIPPWSMDFTAQTWSHVAITAFNGRASGTVSCRLFFDGELVQEAESVGG